MSAADHVGRSTQLRMFMTPREILKQYGPHDADRWITATDMGSLNTVSIPPDYFDMLPQKFGLPNPIDDPRTSGTEYMERWHDTKAKYDRGEELDINWDASYEPGDPEPGTPEFIEEHNPFSLEDHPDWTTREHYIDSWSGEVENIKEAMQTDGFTGDIDQYLDEEKREHDELMAASQEYTLDDPSDRSTWFESDDHVWGRLLLAAEGPTEEVRRERLRIEEPDQDYITFAPRGAGTYDRVEAMGVEDPITLGLDPQVNLKGDIKRPIWKGEHDVVSAYSQKPDTLIPVEHTPSRTPNSVQNRIYPRDERVGKQFTGVFGGVGLAEQLIDVESHMDDPPDQPRVDWFWGEDKPKPLPGPGQLTLIP